MAMTIIDWYFYFMVWMIFYYIINLLIQDILTPVQMVPIINMTNPYYNRRNLQIFVNLKKNK